MDGDENLQLPCRSYQSQLEEIAVNKNTIIHLPTGSGKTFIAVRLINRFRCSLNEPWGFGGKRTFFLVNTIPLVAQQKEVISRLCAVKSIAGYSGENGIDYWDKTKWDAELSEHQVVVMTSQILADMLTHSYIRIEDINLLVFDECHHAVDDHPMRLVMKHFEGCPVADQPRVLGLTATLLNSNVSINKVEETLRELETTFHATIATVNELGEVLNYSTNPNEYLSLYHSCPPMPAAVKAIEILNELLMIVMNIKLPRVSGEPNIKLERWQRDISTDPKKIVKEVKNMIASMIAFIEELGVYGGAISILAYIILLERLKRKAISTEEELLYKITITNATMARNILINKMENDSGYERIIKHSSEKILNLLSILKEFNPEFYTKPTAPVRVNTARQPLSGIIFTRQRFTAKILYNLLKEVKYVNPEFAFLKHDFVVGCNINPYKYTREQFYDKKASQTALLKFGNKELNCLISTSVIEEGVDIPQCLLVLRYDPPLEYRSYIQSKGRARCSDSAFVMLVDEKEKYKFLKQYRDFQETENYIQKMLVGSTEDRGAPSQETIEDDLYNDDEIPPYVTEHGARLSSVQAISLLNRYCSVLPHDQFTVITPMWIEETINGRRVGMKQIKIYMPMACPIRDVISGEPKFQLKAAKRSAALNACITLHKAGELDQHSLLPRQFGTVDFDQPDVQACFPNWPFNDNESEDNKARAGSKKRVRKHRKVFPSYLKGLERLSENQKFYLHIIQMKTAFPEPKDSREKALYQLLQDGSGYGFLTLQALPKLCDFPLFLTIGDISTSIKVNYAVIQLNSKLFYLMKRFHYFLFDQVLDLAQKFIAFDGTENCMYIVPVQRSIDAGVEEYDIDWTVIQTHTEIRPTVPPSLEERKSIRATQENYKSHVVSPWYRGFILPPRYIVSNVLEYMTPYSQFSSNPDDGTFVDYYTSKYNLEIVGDKDQPLLEARTISSRYNCLMPRAATINAFTEKQLKLITIAQGEDKPRTFPEVLIPEFCILFEFPGVLWYKATLIPSVIHRVLMLLVAYELRAEIAKQTKIGLMHLPSGQEWKPIEVNIQVAVNSLLSLVEDPPPIQSIDRINNPIDEEAPRPTNVVTMKQSLYDLQRKKISRQYSWDERIEPLDIERNVSSVTVMDVECYDEFVSTPMSVAMDSTSPVRSPPQTPAAIMPPPVQKMVKIKILGQKPTARGPELRDILTALTTIKSHDTFNFERVETLGDSFLKFSSSLYLYHRFPMLNEGQFTNIKSRLIGNRNLFYAGAKVNLGGRMKVDQFSPRSEFLIPGFFVPRKIQKLLEKKKVRPTSLIGLQLTQEEILSGELSKESWKTISQKLSTDGDNTTEVESVNAHAPMQCYVRAQAVADKSVADCVESLIGTYLLSEGILGAVKVIEWLKLFPPKHNFESMLTKQLPTVLMEGKTTEAEVNRIMNYCREDIETILNYKFKDPSYLLEALSHVSYIRNRTTRSYERLEFLGDAILDFLITSHIFESCPDLKPGDLTDLRSALVNNVTFASYVVRLGLHKYLCYQLNPVLETAIMSFIDHQERRDHTIVEDILYLIDEEDCQIAEYVEVPKVLSDIFESLAGAIYLDSGGNLETVWAVYYRIMCREIQAFSSRIPRQPVRVLYEKIHACPEFGQPQISDSNTQKVMIPVTVTKSGKQITVHGFGSNKFQAKRAAAKLALKVLGI